MFDQRSMLPSWLELCESPTLSAKSVPENILRSQRAEAVALAAARYLAIAGCMSMRGTGKSSLFVLATAAQKRPSEACNSLKPLKPYLNRSQRLALGAWRAAITKHNRLSMQEGRASLLQAMLE